jgi:RsiW-degrading membrane proteinase PrsW (M82 family)
MRPKENIIRRVKIDPSTVWSWALIAAALIAFWATRGTEYHQLALGILLSSVTLLVLLSLVELVWQALEAMFGSGQSDATDRPERRE